MRCQKREADDIAAAKDQVRFRLRTKSNDAAFAADRCCHVEIAAAVEGEALRTAKSAEKRADFSGRIDPIDAVETGSRRAGDEKFAGGTECQVISG